MTPPLNEHRKGAGRSFEGQYRAEHTERFKEIDNAGACGCGCLMLIVVLIVVAAILAFA